MFNRVGFWDWRLNHVRKEAFLKWTFTTGFLMAFILACLSIYWGAFVHIEQNLKSLVVFVVDFADRRAYDSATRAGNGGELDTEPRVHTSNSVGLQLRSSACPKGSVRLGRMGGDYNQPERDCAAIFCSPKRQC
jgi:hypothetical protein